MFAEKAIHFAKCCSFHFYSLPKGPALEQWFENQALSEAVSSVNVDHVDPHNPSLHEILEASRLNKNKDILQLLGEMTDIKFVFFCYEVK